MSARFGAWVLILGWFVGQDAELPEGRAGLRSMVDALKGDEAAKIDAMISALDQVRDTFTRYDAGDADLVSRQRAAMARIFNLHGKESLKAFHWVLKAGGLDGPVSQNMARVRNDMVRLICHEMAREWGQLDRIDFSPAVHMLNDIDQTLRPIKPGQAGPELVKEFNERFEKAFGVPAPHMDVISHPFEARIPDWRKPVASPDARPAVYHFATELRRGSSYLANNPEAYFLEGAFRMQVDRRTADPNQELYTIFHCADGKEVGEVAVVQERKGSAFELAYRFKRPEARRTYAWGAAVGNWYFFRAHGRDVKSAAKYGLRSFAEGPGWLSLVGGDIPDDHNLPKSYADLADQPGKQDRLLDRIYAEHFEGKSDIPKELLKSVLSRAIFIRKAGDKYGEKREEIFRRPAEEIAKTVGDAFESRKDHYLKEAEKQFSDTMDRIMLHDIEVCLGPRVEEWLAPRVNPKFLPSDIRNDPAKVKEAEKRLRTAALFEIVHGLKVLEPGHRTRIVEKLKARLPKERHRVLDAVLRISSERDPILLMTDEQRKGFRKPKSIAVKDGKTLQVDSADVHALHLRMIAESKRRLILDAQDLSEAWFELQIAMGARTNLTDLKGRLDDAIEESKKSVRTLGLSVLDSDVRRAALAQMSRDILSDLGFKFRSDWEAAQGLQRKDVTGFNPVTMANISSLLTIIKAYRDSDGDADAVTRAVFMEGLGRLPFYGTAVDVRLTVQGDPWAAGRLVATILFPELGVVLMAWNVATQSYELYVDVKADQDIEELYRGVLASGKFDTADNEVRAVLHKVLDGLEARKKFLVDELAKGLPDAEHNHVVGLLKRLEAIPRTAEGARSYLFEHFDEILNEKLASNRVPFEEWDAVKLSSDKAPIPDEEKLPPVLLAFFRQEFNRYSKAEGAFAKHAPALNDRSLRFFAFGDSNSKEFFDSMREAVATSLTKMYRDLLRARIRNERNLKAVLPGKNERSTPYLQGMSGLDMKSKLPSGTGDVPDLPSILDPIPGATMDEKLSSFFDYYDARINETLKNWRPKPIPESEWTAKKLELPPAPENEAVKHQLLLAFFNAFVQKHLDAEWAKKLESNIRRDVVHEKLVKQLVKEYVKGLLTDMTRRRQEKDEELLNERLGYYYARERIMNALFGGEESRAQALRELGHHSGDLIAFDDDEDGEKLKAMVDAVPRIQKVELKGARPIKEGAPLNLQCLVSASRHFMPPYVVKWYLVVDGKETEVKDTLPEVKIPLQVGSVQLGRPQVASAVRVKVWDSLDQMIGEAEAVLSASSPVTCRFIDGTSFAQIGIEGYRVPGKRYEFGEILLRFDVEEKTWYHFWNTSFAPPRLGYLQPFDVELPVDRLGEFKGRVTAFAPNQAAPMGAADVQFTVRALERNPLFKPEDVAKHERSIVEFEETTNKWVSEFSEKKTFPSLDAALNSFNLVISGHRGARGRGHLIKNKEALLKKIESIARPALGSWNVASAHYYAKRAEFMMSVGDVAGAEEALKGWEGLNPGGYIGASPHYELYKYYLNVVLDVERAKEMEKKIQVFSPGTRWPVEWVEKKKAMFPQEAFKK